MHRTVAALTKTSLPTRRTMKASWLLGPIYAAPAAPGIDLATNLKVRVCFVDVTSGWPGYLGTISKTRAPPEKQSAEQFRKCFMEGMALAQPRPLRESVRPCIYKGAATYLGRSEAWTFDAFGIWRKVKPRAVTRDAEGISMGDFVRRFPALPMLPQDAFVEEFGASEHQE